MKSTKVANPSQWEAITFTEGTMLVAAGPGSGKTHVISERIRYLIEEKNVLPGHILTITFTKAAACEMQKRCRQICPASAGVVFGTFHSIFYQILRTSEKYQKYTLIKPYEKMQIMQTILPDGAKTAMQKKHDCEVMLQKISKLKNLEPDLQKEESEEVRLIMKQYQKLCHEAYKLDFDDMLLLCYELLSTDLQERRKWQERFRYILVDEYQDVNYPQAELTKLLAGKHGNLFVVGDDDQAIYSFRGSNPKYMQKFLEDYPACKQVFLEENYRCGEQIIRLAGKCISGNTHRIPKQMKVVNHFESKVHWNTFDDRKNEIEYIAAQIKGNAAILVRTNTLTEYIAEMFYAMEISCVVREKRKCFYENVWVQDILAILRFAVLGQKRSDFFMFMNKPYRGILREMADSETVNFKELINRCELQAELCAKMKRLEIQCRMLQDCDPYSAVMFILNGMQYNTYLKQLAGFDENLQRQTEYVKTELLERVKSFRSIRSFLGFVDEYVKGFSEQNDMLQNKETASMRGNVQIMTYHASKGLEFDTVFLPMLNNGIVPHGHMLTPLQMEEERRMFYVAMTRAKQELYLSHHAKERENEISLFYKEIEE